jgi:ferric-dicitrate binding protein FerR (iron transport regulator)
LPFLYIKHGKNTLPNVVFQKKGLMSNYYNEEDWDMLDKWMEDPSFINWAEHTNMKHVAKWEHYLNRYPQHWELAKKGKMLILGISFKEVAAINHESEKALKSLLDTLQNDLGKDKKTLSKKRTRAYRFWKFAASVAAILLISAGIYWYQIHNPQIVLATNFGHQLETILPDESVVTLNANSKLRYYKQDSRKVWLEGEAYFVIKKKPETGEEFQIITKDLNVTVLGTSFNVNTRNDQTEVLLEEGKVSLAVADQKQTRIEMNPGDLITYSKKSNLLEEKRGNAPALETAAWKKGALIFKNSSLVDALFEMEDIYGIQFVIQTEELKEETISGGIPIKDLQVTLKTLTEIYGIQMQVTGNRYFITGRD